MTNTLTGTPGALIKTVVVGSPAAKAGLKAGDVIVAVDGKNLSDAGQLREVIQSHKSGDEITLTVVTSTPIGHADRRDVKVVLTTRPAQRQFQMPPGFQPGVPGLDSREG